MWPTTAHSVQMPWGRGKRISRGEERAAQLKGQHLQRHQAPKQPGWGWGTDGGGVSPRREQHSCKGSGLEAGMTPVLLKSILGLLQPSESHEPSPHNRGMR